MTSHVQETTEAHTYEDVREEIYQNVQEISKQQYVAEVKFLGIKYILTFLLLVFDRIRNILQKKFKMVPKKKKL